MQSKTLLAFLLLAMSIMIAPITVFASQDNGDENGNGDNQNGQEVRSDEVRVEVTRGENDTEEINVTPNVTVIVDFNTTQVTNESVSIGSEPGVTPTEPPTEANQTQNATVPTEPTNCVTAPCPPSEPQVPIEGNVTTPGNETQVPIEGNVTIGNETTTEPPSSQENQTTPLPPSGGNETQTEQNQTGEPIPFPPPDQNGTGTSTGNQTVDQNQTGPPIILPPDIGQNETTPVEGNTTAPPVTPTTPVNETQQGNQTVPTEPTLPPPDTNIPTDNGTVVVEPPTDRPTQINLALVESIQRGHIQHVTAYVTDDSGNEFVDETVTLQVVNARGVTIQDEVLTSGQTFHYKVGPNTSPQSINVYATLDSDPSIAGQASYDVYPKPRVIIDLPPQPMPFAQ